jgi:parallel beta-helix repeat protein
MRTVRLVILMVGAAGLLAAWAPTAAVAASHTVNPGESIQAAVDAALPGDTVKVLPGDYVGVPAGSVSAAVRITKPLKLIAKSKISDGLRVRILPGAGQSHGILVEPANPGDPDIVGVMIKGFTVQGFSNNGIWLRHVQKFKIQGNESINNLENGIFPTLSANGQVKKNVSYGSQDSALWVEASENVRILKNELYNSPTGLEITVSKDILIKKNDVHDNTVGIGLYHPNAAAEDPLPVMDGWQVLKNHVHNNNYMNSAPSGSMAASLPPGGGILVLGVDNVTVAKNDVENNDFFGVAAVDWCFGVSGGPFDCSTSPPIDGDPAPNDNSIKKNDVAMNGGNPPPGLFSAFAADLTLVAPTGGMYPPGMNNCFEDNTAGASEVFVPENQCM